MVWLFKLSIRFSWAVLCTSVNKLIYYNKLILLVQENSPCPKVPWAEQTTIVTKIKKILGVWRISMLRCFSDGRSVAHCWDNTSPFVWCGCHVTVWWDVTTVCIMTLIGWIGDKNTYFAWITKTVNIFTLLTVELFHILFIFFYLCRSYWSKIFMTLLSCTDDFTERNVKVTPLFINHFS